MTKDEISNCDKLVLKVCLSKDSTTVKEAIREWDSLINIDDLSFRSMRLCPMLLYQCDRFDVKSLFDKRLRVIYKYWWIKSKLIHDNVNSICRLLTDHGIKPIILKGGSVSHYYPKLELRTMADIDLMVLYPNLEESIHILETSGFKFINYQKALLKNHRSYFYYYHEPIQLKNEQLDIEVDLHWSGGTLLSKGHGESLYQRTVKAKNIRNSGYIPTPSDELALIILHGTLTNSHDNYNWLLDVQVLNENLTKEDWDKAYEISVKEKKEDYFIYGLNLLEESGVDIQIHRPTSQINQLNFTIPLIKGKERIISHYWIALKNSLIIIRNLFPHENVLLRIVRLLQFFQFNLLKGFYIKDIGK